MIPCATKILVLLCSCALILAVPVFGHGGGLDKLGCHRDRKADNYHCHRGQLKGQAFANKTDAQAVIAGRSASSSTALATTGVPYDRSLYGGWIDADGDCQDTRQEVLIQESQVPVVLDADGCKVGSGQWYDPLTGKTFTNPRRLDIDHFVPLAEVHRSGGHSWPSARRKSYANDLGDPLTLIAVSASANRSKSDKDPAKWLPPNAAFHCEYVKIWVLLKEQWGLEMDAAEAAKVEEVLRGCG